MQYCAKKENKLVAGKEFADAINGRTKAPDVVTILSGEYLIGENASKQVNLDHAYAIGATPVTVTQFENFISKTNYQTDAELKNTCTTVEGSEVTPIAKSYWRDPGFKQYPNSPVVCVSRNDASAYARWLSNETGFKYRLPSEDEWEIAPWQVVTTITGGETNLSPERRILAGAEHLGQIRVPRL